MSICVIIRHYCYNHHNHWKCRGGGVLSLFVTCSFGGTNKQTFYLFFFLTWTIPPPPPSLPSGRSWLSLAKLALSHLASCETVVPISMDALSHSGTRSVGQPPCDCLETLGLISDLQSFPGVAVFGGLSPLRLHGDPNPHKRSNQTTLGWSDQRDPAD